MSRTFTSYRLLLSELESEIAGDNVDLVSFDVFDTLVHRKLDPDQIVQGVCRRLERLVVSSGYTIARPAAVSRHEAYVSVAERNHSDGKDFDALLADFAVEWVALVVGRSIDESEVTRLAAVVCEMELDSELKAIYANPVFKQWLSKLRHRLQTRLVCISDMYLSKEQLCAVLESKGLLHFFDDVYVSAEEGFLKRTGRLYSHVHEKEGNNKARWLHVGDNHFSDGQMAESQGLRSWLIDDEHYHAIQRRQQFDHRYVYECPDWFGVMAANYVQHVYEQIDNGVEAYGCRMFGPVVSSFVHRLLEVSRERGIEKIYFFAREGLVLKDIYLALTRNLCSDGGAPVPVYLAVSRLTTFLAAMRGYGLREFTSVIANGNHYTVRTLMAPLGMSEDVLADIASRSGIPDIDMQMPPDFLYWPRLHRMLDDPDLCGEIDRLSERSRSLLIEYLREEGFFDAGRVAFVDVGWSGQIQDNIYSAVRNVENCPAITGLYLGTTRKVCDRSVPGSEIISVLADEFRPEWSASAVFDFVFAFEAACRAHHGTTISYRDPGGGGNHVEPVFKEDGSASRSSEIKDDPALGLMQRGLLKYAEEYAEFVGLAGVTSVDTIDYARTIISRMVRFPTRQEYGIWKEIHNVSDLGSEEMNELGSGVRAGPVMLLFPWKLRSALRRSFWRYGLAGDVSGRPLQVILSVAVAMIRLNDVFNWSPRNKPLYDHDACSQISGSVSDVPERQFESVARRAMYENAEAGASSLVAIKKEHPTCQLTPAELVPTVLSYRLVMMICRLRRINYYMPDYVSIVALLKRRYYISLRGSVRRVKGVPGMYKLVQRLAGSWRR